MPRSTKVTNGWFIFDMRNLLLHIMTVSVREKYELEKLHTNSEENEEDGDLLPPPVLKESSSTASTSS